MLWMEMEQILLDTELHNAASWNPQLKNKSDAVLPKLSDLYNLLIPELEEIQDLKPELLGRVKFASAAGISSYMPHHWLGSERDQKRLQLLSHT
jgi:hypothetical protein